MGKLTSYIHVKVYPPRDNMSKPTDASLRGHQIWSKNSFFGYHVSYGDLGYRPLFSINPSTRFESRSMIGDISWSASIAFSIPPKVL